VILLSQHGLAASQIADLLGYHPSTVRRWSHRYHPRQSRVTVSVVTGRLASSRLVDSSTPVSITHRHTSLHLQRPPGRSRTHCHNG
jgi:IS30 family transposase